VSSVCWKIFADAKKLKKPTLFASQRSSLESVVHNFFATQKIDVTAAQQINDNCGNGPQRPNPATFGLDT
jgi:hypothetical protein